MIVHRAGERSLASLTIVRAVRPSTDSRAARVRRPSIGDGSWMSQLWISELFSQTTLAAHLHTPGERRTLYNRARGGLLIRVHPGCYVDAAFWGELSSAAQHRARAHLAAASGADLEFSHLTAAALWGLPVMGDWPSRAHVSGPKGPGVRKTATLARHSLGFDPHAVTIDGLRVTSLAVTVAQVAASEPFATGVVIADAALHATRGLDLRPAVLAVPRFHGRARALAVAAFADGRADSPGESVSRVSMRAAGLPAPELQVVIYGASGKRYVVDFYWRTLRLIGEFDGEFKLTDPEFLRGRTPAKALSDEKLREDDLRATKRGMTRWGYQLANSPVLLAHHLRLAGL